VSPILADGKIVGVSKIARDITSQKQVQLAQTLLLRELNHRTKNLLAVADAIVRQTSKSSPPEELLDRISRRLHALSVSQDLMIDSEWRGADITNIIQWQLASIIDDHTSRVKLNGPLCTLNPRTAQALGLAIFELATNARVSHEVAGTWRPSCDPAGALGIWLNNYRAHDRPFPARLG
jgi:two-component sensor histidine kinase